MMKTKILEHICYTELVYDRINKKLKTNYSRANTEKLLSEIIEKTKELFVEKRGKNFYISNKEHGLRITINSNTYRVITVDLLAKIKKNN